MNWRSHRPWLAAVFAFVYPGLGHVYLRAWIRALVWFGLALLTAALVVPESAVQAFETGGLQGLLDASRTFPMATVLPLLVVRTLNVLDAFLIGADHRAAGFGGGPGRDDHDGPSCPNCGQELDEDLDFCHWCTTELPDRGGEEETDPGPASR